MKFKGRLFIILLVTELFACSTHGAQKPKETSPKNKTISEAVITKKDPEIASSPYESIPKEDVINTLYPDPLSDEFMGTNSEILNSERNRSTSDLVKEFEGQAKIINDNTQVPDNIIDNHSKEDRDRIEARADKLIKEGIQKEKVLLGKREENKESSTIAEESLSLYDEKLDTTQDDSNIERVPNEIMTSEANDSEFGERGEIILTQDNGTNDEAIDNVPLTNEIPDYANLQGLLPLNEKQEQAGEKEPTQENKTKKKKVKLTKKQKQQRKMAEPLEPVLLIGAKPKNEEEKEKTLSFTGILIPEVQPLGKKKYMNRWVLELDDGSRIPLKSSLKLLQEVRKEGILDDYVTIEGKILVSPMEKKLKYLVPESFKKEVRKATTANLESLASNGSDSQSPKNPDSQPASELASNFSEDYNSQAYSELSSNISNSSDSQNSSNLSFNPSNDRIEPKSLIASDSLSLAADG